MLADMTPYRFYFLGTVQIKKDEIPLHTVRSRKGLALLGYLTQQQGPVSRANLAAMFWTNKAEDVGRRNLSRELSELADQLPGCFRTDYHTIQFDPGIDYWVDTHRFRQLVANSNLQITYAGPATLPSAPRVESEAHLAELDEALALYRGDFMAGHYVDDSPDFETWLLREQSIWQQQMTKLLEYLAVQHTMRGHDERAEIYFRRWLALEPWQERIYCYLMLILARKGQRGAALNLYQQCRLALAKELEAEPSAETTALYERIQKGQEDGEVKALNGSMPIEAAKTGTIVPLPANPYRGLNAYGKADARFFFGREHFTERLREAVQTQPLVAIIGPSGSGKSSVVEAGLLAQLWQDEPAPIPTNKSALLTLSKTTTLPAPHHTFISATFRPGHQPFHAMSASLISLLEHNQSETTRLLESNKLAEALSHQQLALSDVVTQILRKHNGSPNLLLVIDQFEELFTLCDDTETRERFLDTLLEMVIAPQTPIRLHIILTLRADFMGHALAYRPLADALQQNMLNLGPMTPQEARQAIEEPARVQGVLFEAGLVEKILQDVAHTPAKLPLLEFALTSLWEMQAEQGSPLTHHAYKAIGGVQGALAYYADATYSQLSLAEQEQARRVLVKLVQPGIGTEDTSRLSRRDELGKEGWRMAQRLADLRLVVTDRGIDGHERVEIVHEALIREWSQLNAWLNEDRAFRTWQERQRLLRNPYGMNELDEGMLLRGSLLVEAEAWYQTRANDMSPTERLLVETSIAQRDEKLREEYIKREQDERKLESWWERVIDLQETETRNKRTLAQLQDQVEQEHQSRQKMLMIIYSLIAVTIAAIVTAAWGLWF